MAEEMFLGLYETYVSKLPSRTYFQFKEAVLNYQGKLASMGTKVYEDGGESLEKVDALRIQLHKTLKGILGKGSFERYLEYEKTLGIRNRLIQMKRRGGFFVPDEKVREKLVQAMVEVDRTLKVPSTPKEQIEFFRAGLLNEKTKKRVIDLNWKATQAYIKSSKEILSGPLWADFKKNLEGAAAMLEYGLNNSYEETVLNRDSKKTDQK